MPKETTVYTTSTCAWCAAVKKLLDYKKVPYKVVNLDEQPEQRDAIFSKAGAWTVPIVKFIKNDNSEEIVVGYNTAKLMPILNGA